jgi:hypothetical protein
MRAGYQSHETAFGHVGTSTQVSDHSGRSAVNGSDRVVGHYGVPRKRETTGAPAPPPMEPHSRTVPGPLEIHPVWEM